MNSDSIIELLAQNKGCRFASFVYTSKSSNETARHTVLLGFSYINAVQASLNELREKFLTLTNEIEIQAASELIESFNATLNGTQEGFTKKGLYLSTGISGLNVNSNDGSLQLYGLAQSKVVIVPGTYKEVKSNPKTIAKNKLRHELPIGKFREFALDAGNIHAIKATGETLEFE
jgi:hypothetical protein